MTLQIATSLERREYLLASDTSSVEGLVGLHCFEEEIGADSKELDIRYPDNQSDAGAVGGIQYDNL